MQLPFPSMDSLLGTKVKSLNWTLLFIWKLKHWLYIGISHQIRCIYCTFFLDKHLIIYFFFFVVICLVHFFWYFGKIFCIYQQQPKQTSGSSSIQYSHIFSPTNFIYMYIYNIFFIIQSNLDIWKSKGLVKDFTLN